MNGCKANNDTNKTVKILLTANSDRGHDFIVDYSCLNFIVFYFNYNMNSIAGCHGDNNQNNN